jgi:hypothetical protein
MTELITSHPFIECPCKACGECVFEIAPGEKPSLRYCRQSRAQHATALTDDERDALMAKEATDGRE